MPSLQFKGKPFVENHHLAVPFHELSPVQSRGLSQRASLHDNLLIEGDNLAALKALLPTHHRTVKCIYIDPPYNTGNEGWAYSDRVKPRVSTSSNPRTPPTSGPSSTSAPHTQGRPIGPSSSRP